jgi:hypothetical protein
LLASGAVSHYVPYMGRFESSVNSGRALFFFLTGRTEFEVSADIATATSLGMAADGLTNRESRHEDGADVQVGRSPDLTANYPPRTYTEDPSEPVN